MEFNFIEPETENGNNDEDEVLDLSDVLSLKKESKSKRMAKRRRVVVSKERTNKQASTQDTQYLFEDEIPQPKSITDKDVQKKAQQGRKRSVSKMSYENKKENGWSFYCAHPQHLPTLCERAQDNYEVSCSCSCHKERLYIQPEPKSLSASDDEEIILLFD